MTAPIDWSRPIELDTVPPRPALAGTGPTKQDESDVHADWDSDGVTYGQWVNPFGEVIGRPYLPRVRNVVTPTDDLAVAPKGARRVRPLATDDVTAELLAAMKDALRQFRPGWNNGDAGEAMRILKAAIAKAEARK